MTASKTVQLGVIVLALELLRQWKFPVPRIIAALARFLGVSRKSGYEAAERILRQLSADDEKAGHEGFEREYALLRIRVQVLTYERDHDGLRFSERRCHLPEEAKSLCVRVFRDFRDRLGKSEIAIAIGVAPSSLRRWDEEADEHCRFPEKADARGKQRHHREEDETRVLDLWAQLEEPTTITDFSSEYKKAHPKRPLDPKTILRILQKHGLKPHGAKDRAPRYRDKVAIYFPGAQAALDATECKVHFVGRGEEKTVELKEEVALDLASGAILGTALREEEDSEGVERVVVQAREECEKLLAVLADNGSANSSQSVKRLVDEKSAVGSIFSFPRHPQTNGHLEGFFGRFKRIVGALRIDDTTRESTARSVLAIIWGIYTYFHNYSPCGRLGGLSRVEYLRRYAPIPQEVEAARRDLAKRKRRSESLRGPNPRLAREEFRELVEGVLAEHRFEIDLEPALRSLVPYDTAVIESSSRAFFVASCRDGFDERKRSFAYFMGIVRNKQREVDGARLSERALGDRTRQVTERYRRQEREVERERAQEAKDLREHPERVVLQAAKLLLSGGLELMRGTFLRKLREALRALERLGRNRRAEIERLALEIGGWGEYGEGLKREMVVLLKEEAASVTRDATPRGSFRVHAARAPPVPEA